MDTAHTFRASDGVTIAYRIARAGASPAPLLILIHGLASNVSRWAEFVEHTRLRGNWDLLRLDLRGHGGSFTRRGIGLARWVEDLRELLDHERCDSAVLAGHSLGAQVAVHFGAKYPSRTRALILVDPVLRQVLRGELRLAAHLAPLLRAFAAVVSALNSIGLRRRSIPARDLRALDEIARRECLSEQRQREMVAHYSSVLEDLRFFPVASFVREVLAMIDPLPALESLSMPVLALLSTGITYTQPHRIRELLARLPQGRTATVDAYHWPLTERPVEVREAIDIWCGELAAQGPGRAAAV